MLAKAPRALRAAENTEKYMKGMVSPGNMFEQLGFNYIGMIDGHNLNHLLDVLGNIKNLSGPRLLHVVTRKGKGYTESENDPFGMHAMGKAAPIKDVRKASQSKTKSSPTYSQVFGRWLCDAARRDEKLVAITPAMGEGSGMVEFSRKFPDRFHDVAIAEQHSLTSARDWHVKGSSRLLPFIPRFARAYDQLTTTLPAESRCTVRDRPAGWSEKTVLRMPAACLTFCDASPILL